MTWLSRSPDGSVALSHCENRSFQMLYPYARLPAELNLSIWSFVDRTSDTEPRCFHQPAPIVDYAWYPSATVNNPAVFCFLASVRECPVKLLDASDGRVSQLTASFQPLYRWTAADDGMHAMFCSSERRIRSWTTENDRSPLTASRLTSTPQSIPPVPVSFLSGPFF